MNGWAIAKFGVTSFFVFLLFQLFYFRSSIYSQDVCGTDVIL